jgi:hypothetical protein
LQQQYQRYHDLINQHIMQMTNNTLTGVGDAKNLDITAPLQPLTHEDFFQSKNSD